MLRTKTGHAEIIKRLEAEKSSRLKKTKEDAEKQRLKSITQQYQRLEKQLRKIREEIQRIDGHDNSENKSRLVKLQDLQKELEETKLRLEKKEKLNPISSGSLTLNENKRALKLENSQPTKKEELIADIKDKIIDAIIKIFDIKLSLFQRRILTTLNTKPLKCLSSQTLNDLETFSEEELDKIKKGYQLIREIGEIFEVWKLNLEGQKNYRTDKSILKVMQDKGQSLSQDEKTIVWDEIKKKVMALTYDTSHSDYKANLKRIAAAQVEKTIAMRKVLDPETPLSSNEGAAQNQVASDSNVCHSRFGR